MSENHNCTSHLVKHTDGKRHLPQPRGPHSVGFFDIMTPGEPQKGSLMRVYYPTLQQCLEESHTWPVWIENKYTAGLFTFMKSVLHRWPSWAPQGEFAMINVLKHITPLLPHIGFPALFKLLVGVVYVPIIRNAEPCSSQKWPLIIFSHGMGCARFTYSQICYDLASHGFIVAAPEHRDGSGCLSFYNDCGTRKWIHHRRIEHSDDEYAVRNSQVQQRASEVKRVLDIMTSINKGDYVENVLGPDEVGTEMDLSLLKDKIDLSSPIIAGHSFGGATALLSLALEPRFKIGIVLDGWLFPLRDEDLAPKVNQPIIFINTESFLNPENLLKQATFSKSEAERQSFFIRGSVHQNHLDTAFVVQQVSMRKALGVHSKTCCELVMNLTNKMMIQFIRKILSLPEDQEVNAEVENQKKIIIPGFEPKILTSTPSV